MVEWKKLGDICNILDSQRKPVSKGDRKEGKYPYYGANGIQDYVDSFIFDGTYLLMGEDGSVINTDKSPVIHWATGKIWVNNHAHVLEENDSAYLRYIYYSLQCTDVSDLVRGVPPKINQANLRGILIPVPSKNEQNRIVGILDTFTASIDNLKEQIAQRRKQYEYYRDQLLDLEGKEGVEMKKIGDLFVFKNGLNKEKKYFGEGTPIVNYTDVYHNKRLDSSILNGRVTLSENEIDRFRVHKGDVFFTRTSETPEEVGYAAVILEEVENCTFSGFLLRARPITNLILPEFCAYCFGSYKVRQAIVKYSTFTTRALTNGPSLSKISVPIPSLSEQQRIVSILDTFEASIQNLEAQLSQREKQYEYYRNKLLKFE